jgi:hypothetical protein
LDFCPTGGRTRAKGTVAAAEAVGIHQARTHPHRQGGAGEEIFVLVVVEVLVCQAQVGQIALTEGAAIHRVPEGRQVKALGHLFRLTHRHHVVAIGGVGVEVGLPAARTRPSSLTARLQ